MATYATTRDLAEYLGDAPPENAHALLARAGRVVDGLAALLAFDVDTDGATPTDPVVRSALRDATCAQVQAWIDSGRASPPSGAGVELAAAGLGSVSFGAVKLDAGSTATRQARTPGPDWATPARAALDELQRAGLWPPAVALC